MFSIVSFCAKNLLPYFSFEDILTSIVPTVKELLCAALVDVAPKTITFTQQDYEAAFMSYDLDQEDGIWRQLVTNITTDPTDFTYELMRKYQACYARAMLEAFRDDKIILLPTDAAFPSQPTQNGFRYFSPLGATSVLPLEMIELSCLDLVLSAISVILKAGNGINIESYSITNRHKHASDNFCRKHKILSDEQLAATLRDYESFRALMPETYTDPDTRKLHETISQDLCINAIIEQRKLAGIEYPYI